MRLSIRTKLRGGSVNVRAEPPAEDRRNEGSQRDGVTHALHIKPECSREIIRDRVDPGSCGPSDGAQKRGRVIFQNYLPPPPPPFRKGLRTASSPFPSIYSLYCEHGYSLADRNSFGKGIASSIPSESLRLIWTGRERH